MVVTVLSSVTVLHRDARYTTEMQGSGLGRGDAASLPAQPPPREGGEERARHHYDLASDLVYAQGRREEPFSCA